MQLTLTKVRYRDCDGRRATSPTPISSPRENRHGNFVWYVRVNRKTPRIRIHAKFGTPDFAAEYQAAVTGADVVASKNKLVAGSFEWLVRQWKQSSDWHRTSEATKQQRDNIINRILVDNGTVPFKNFTTKAIMEGRERRMATPAAANNFLKVMRALFRWTSDPLNGFMAENPAAKVPFLSLKSEGHETWTDHDLEKFRSTWAVGTRERLAMELLYWTGLRRGDAVRLGRQHLKGGMIYLKAEKTGVALNIPVVPELAAILDVGPTGDLAFIASVKGQPMTKESFGTWFRKVCNVAGVSGSAHGLRKECATHAANEGASELELQSFYGWKNPAQSQTYTRKANAEKLAKAMGEKLSANMDSRTSEQVRELPENNRTKSRG